jgi:hypothetical protein
MLPGVIAPVKLSQTRLDHLYALQDTAVRLGQLLEHAGTFAATGVCAEVGVFALALRAPTAVAGARDRPGRRDPTEQRRGQPLVTLERSGLLAKLGADNALPDLQSALERARS